MPNEKPENKERLKPITLSPLTLDDALGALLKSGKPDARPKSTDTKTSKPESALREDE